MSKKIIIFGGSFDPVHKEHEKIVKKLSSEFNEVIVVPSFISPFKAEGAHENAEHRLKLLNIVFEKLDNVKVSNYEIEKGGTSFTLDTVKHFQDIYSKKDGNEEYQMFFCIGSDLINSLETWKSFDTLKNLVAFFIVKRKGFSINSKLIKSLIDNGAKIELSQIRGSEASSSQVGVAIAFSKNDCISKIVLNYIKENKLYNNYEKFIDAFKTFTLKNERVEHTYRAIKAGILLSKLHDVNVQKTIIALYIHDMGKNASDETLLENGIKLNEEIKQLPQPLIHAEVGKLIAKNYFNISDDEILCAIAQHTSGDIEMSNLSKVVYLADLTESERKFEGLNIIRRAAKKSLNTGMELALKYTIDYLTSNNQNIFYKSINAYEYYKKLNSNKSMEKIEMTEVNEEKEVKKTALKKSPVKKTATEKTEAKTSVKTESIKKTKAAPKAKAAPKEKTEAKKVAVNDEAYDLAYTMAQYIDEKKGKDITIIKLQGKSIIADYFVIATASSTTAVKSLTEYLDEKLSKEHNIEPLRRDIDSTWAAIDYGFVILHVQTEETREHYKLEKLWSDGTNVERFSETI